MTQVSNFLKTLFLIQHANLTVLPEILNKIEETVSLKEFKTELTHYYTHLARIFIPNLFAILYHHPKTRKDFKVVHQLSKFLLEFPIDWFPQVQSFVQSITDFAIKNLESLSLFEIFDILKLHEFIEIRYGKVFIDDKTKESFISAILKQKEQLLDDQLEMLIQFRFTLFKTLSNKLESLLEILNTILDETLKKIKERFSDQYDKHYCETTIYEKLFAVLAKENAQCLKFSHVCNKTGKEIDIAFVSSTHRIAIHIDGRANHRYLDREFNNRRTLVRNEALKNAGWQNVMQIIPDKINDKVLQQAVNQLYEKLKLCTGLNFLKEYHPSFGNKIGHIVSQFLLSTPESAEYMSQSFPGLAEEDILTNQCKNRLDN